MRKKKYRKILLIYKERIYLIYFICKYRISLLYY